MLTVKHSAMGLEYRPVLADSGAIGGSGSQEFHVLAESGEDLIAFSSESDCAANIEKAKHASSYWRSCSANSRDGTGWYAKRKNIAELVEQHGLAIEEDS